MTRDPGQSYRELQPTSELMLIFQNNDWDFGVLKDRRILKKVLNHVTQERKKYFYLLEEAFLSGEEPESSNSSETYQPNDTILAFPVFPQLENENIREDQIISFNKKIQEDLRNILKIRNLPTALRHKKGDKGTKETRNENKERANENRAKNRYGKTEVGSIPHGRLLKCKSTKTVVRKRLSYSLPMLCNLKQPSIFELSANENKNIIRKLTTTFSTVIPAKKLTNVYSGIEPTKICSMKPSVSRPLPALVERGVGSDIAVRRIKNSKPAESITCASIRSKNLLKEKVKNRDFIQENKNALVNKIRKRINIIRLNNSLTGTNVSRSVKLLGRGKRRSSGKLFQDSHHRSLENNKNGQNKATIRKKPTSLQLKVQKNQGSNFPIEKFANHCLKGKDELKKKLVNIPAKSGKTKSWYVSNNSNSKNKSIPLTSTSFKPSAIVKNNKKSKEIKRKSSNVQPNIRSRKKKEKEDPMILDNSISCDEILNVMIDNRNDETKSEIIDSGSNVFEYPEPKQEVTFEQEPMEKLQQKEKKFSDRVPKNRSPMDNLDLHNKISKLNHKVFTMQTDIKLNSKLDNNIKQKLVSSNHLGEDLIDDKREICSEIDQQFKAGINKEENKVQKSLPKTVAKFLEDSDNFRLMGNEIPRQVYGNEFQDEDDLYVERITKNFTSELRPTESYFTMMNDIFQWIENMKEETDQDGSENLLNNEKGITKDCQVNIEIENAHKDCQADIEMKIAIAHKDCQVDVGKVIDNSHKDCQVDIENEISFNYTPSLLYQSQAERNTPWGELLSRKKPFQRQLGSTNDSNSTNSKSSFFSTNKADRPSPQTDLLSNPLYRRKISEVVDKNATALPLKSKTEPQTKGYSVLHTRTDRSLARNSSDGTIGDQVLPLKSKTDPQSNSYSDGFDLNERNTSMRDKLLYENKLHRLTFGDRNLAEKDKNIDRMDLSKIDRFHEHLIHPNETRMYTVKKEVDKIFKRKESTSNKFKIDNRIPLKNFNDNLISPIPMNPVGQENCFEENRGKLLHPGNLFSFETYNNAHLWDYSSNSEYLKNKTIKNKNIFLRGKHDSYNRNSHPLECPDSRIGFDKNNMKSAASAKNEKKLWDSNFTGFKSLNRSKIEDDNSNQCNMISALPMNPIGQMVSFEEIKKRLPPKGNLFGPETCSNERVWDYFSHSNHLENKTIKNKNKFIQGLYDPHNEISPPLECHDKTNCFDNNNERKQYWDSNFTDFKSLDKPNKTDNIQDRQHKKKKVAVQDRQRKKRTIAMHDKNCALVEKVRNIHDKIIRTTVDKNDNNIEGDELEHSYPNHLNDVRSRRLKPRTSPKNAKQKFNEKLYWTRVSALDENNANASLNYGKICNCINDTPTEKEFTNIVTVKKAEIKNKSKPRDSITKDYRQVRVIKKMCKKNSKKLNSSTTNRGKFIVKHCKDENSHEPMYNPHGIQCQNCQLSSLKTKNEILERSDKYTCVTCKKVLPFDKRNEVRSKYHKDCCKRADSEEIYIRKTKNKRRLISNRNKSSFNRCIQSFSPEKYNNTFDEAKALHIFNIAKKLNFRPSRDRIQLEDNKVFLSYVTGEYNLWFEILKKKALELIDSKTKTKEQLSNLFSTIKIFCPHKDISLYHFSNFAVDTGRKTLMKHAKSRSPPLFSESKTERSQEKRVNQGPPTIQEESDRYLGLNYDRNERAMSPHVKFRSTLNEDIGADENLIELLKSIRVLKSDIGKKQMHEKKNLFLFDNDPTKFLWDKSNFLSNLSYSKYQYGPVNHKHPTLADSTIDYVEKNSGLVIDQNQVDSSSTIINSDHDARPSIGNCSIKKEFLPDLSVDNESNDVAIIEIRKRKPVRKLCGKNYQKYLSPYLQNLHFKRVNAKLANVCPHKMKCKTKVHKNKKLKDETVQVSVSIPKRHVGIGVTNTVICNSCNTRLFEPDSKCKPDVQPPPGTKFPLLKKLGLSVSRNKNELNKIETVNNAKIAKKSYEISEIDRVAEIMLQPNLGIVTPQIKKMWTTSRGINVTYHVRDESVQKGKGKVTFKNHKKRRIPISFRIDRSSIVPTNKPAKQKTVPLWKY